MPVPARGTTGAAPDGLPLRVVLLVVCAAVVTSVGLHYYFVVNAHSHDFALFVYEGRNWIEGRPLYATSAPNTNSPALTVSVFAALALLPYAMAQWLWLTFSLIAMVASWRLIARELHLSRDQAIMAAALGFLTHPSVQGFAVGQVTIPLLLYPVTRAWMAYRRGNLVAAGCWLAPAIAIKPPLALAALLLPLKTWSAAGALSLALSSAVVPITGLGPWREWLAAGSAISWLRNPFNASLWGMAARWTGAYTLADLSTAVVALVLVGGAVFAAQVLAQPNRDRRMLGALLWSVLLSPLGWGHYLVLAFGPAVALWPRSWVAWLAYLLLLAPFGGSVQVGPLLGSLYFVAVLLWWALARVPSRLPRKEPVQT